MWEEAAFKLNEDEILDHLETKDCINWATGLQFLDVYASLWLDLSHRLYECMSGFVRVLLGESMKKCRIQKCRIV